MYSEFIVWYDMIACITFSLRKGGFTVGTYDLDLQPPVQDRNKLLDILENQGQQIVPRHSDCGKHIRSKWHFLGIAKMCKMCEMF